MPYNNESIDKIESVSKDRLIRIDEEGERCVYVRKLPPEQEELKKDNTIPQNDKLEVEKFLRKTTEIVEKYMRWESVKQSYINIYSDVYSNEELKALIEFYRTPLGKKVLDNMQELTRKTMILVEEQQIFATAELTKFIADFINEKIQEESEKEDQKRDGA